MTQTIIAPDLQFERDGVTFCVLKYVGGTDEKWLVSTASLKSRGRTIHCVRLEMAATEIHQLLQPTNMRNTAPTQQSVKMTKPKLAVHTPKPVTAKALPGNKVYAGIELFKLNYLRRSAQPKSHGSLS